MQFDTSAFLVESLCERTTVIELGKSNLLPLVSHDKRNTFA